jgi:3-dehydroquinate dehydratase-1
MRLQSEHAVRVKDKIIGGATPLVCLPLVAGDRQELLDQARDLIKLSPDLLEWRVDGFNDAQNIDAVTQALTDLNHGIGSIPLIFTCRVDREGGMQRISPEKRLDLITASMETGLPDIVDIELCNGAGFIQTVIDCARQNNVKIILSSHDFKKTPAEDVILERLVRARDLGADIAKVAAMPENYNDVLVLMSATLKARTGMLKIPIVTMAMGEQGVVTRIAGGIFGSDITFAIGKNSSAPGQIPIEKLRQAMSVLYP